MSGQWAEWKQKIATADAAEQLVRDLRAKTELLERELTATKTELAAAEAAKKRKWQDMEKKTREAEELRIERDRLRIETEGQAAMIRFKVKQAIEKFTRLFSLPVIEGDPILLLDGWTHP